MEKLKIGILGISSHFLKRIAQSLADCESVKIIALASSKAAKAEAVAQELGIERWYDNYAKLLEDPKIEAVYISLPNHLHAYWCKEAAAAGKHIICEKPLATSFEEAKEIQKAVNTYNVFLLEGFMYKFHPQWQHVRQLIQRNEIGTLNSIFIHFAILNQDPENIRNRPETAGGVFLDLGCYAFSAIRFLTGKEPLKLGGNFIFDPQTGVDIQAAGFLLYEKIQGAFWVGMRSAPFQRVTIQGSKGLIEIPIPFNPLPYYPAEVFVYNEGGRKIHRLPPSDQYKIMFEKFAEAVKGLAPLPFELEDSIQNSKAMEDFKKNTIG